MERDGILHTRAPAALFTTSGMVLPDVTNKRRHTLKKDPSLSEHGFASVLDQIRRMENTILQTIASAKQELVAVFSEKITPKRHVEDVGRETGSDVTSHGTPQDVEDLGSSNGQMYCNPQEESFQEIPILNETFLDSNGSVREVSAGETSTVENIAKETSKVENVEAKTIAINNSPEEDLYEAIRGLRVTFEPNQNEMHATIFEPRDGGYHACLHSRLLFSLRCDNEKKPLGFRAPLALSHGDMEHNSCPEDTILHVFTHSRLVASLELQRNAGKQFGFIVDDTSSRNPKRRKFWGLSESTIPSVSVHNLRIEEESIKTTSCSWFHVVLVLLHGYHANYFFEPTRLTLCLDESKVSPHMVMELEAVGFGRVSVHGGMSGVRWETIIYPAPM